ncbi:MAG: hypothetical protein DI563_21280 [Variovorax paradoxus]|uniref:Uncharacterized protein n=1 Tax=Variovorax paradoxus TaxID=34073 RepID=A0A2W5PQF4_VARPD|nr:MAG: hypothetical protein DI563_21280 [Variovorax paradoxus]
MGAISGALMLAARWLFVLVVALDLVSAPMHAHHHQGGPETYLSHSETLDAGDADADLAVSGDAHEDHAIHGGSAKAGHSVSAVRADSGLLSVDAPSTDGWVLAHAWLSLVVATAASALEAEQAAWPPCPSDLTPSSPHLVRPTSRAPPQLHA